MHPKAILDYPNIDSDLKKAVESVARGHASPRAFYVDKLAEGIATIAAAFWPKPVIVRLSDFKSNEYQKLIGGSRYEPEEENPMLGFRGASRYVSESFGEAFAMECEALEARARATWASPTSRSWCRSCARSARPSAWSRCSPSTA